MIRLKLSIQWCRITSLKNNVMALEGKMYGYNLLKELVH